MTITEPADLADEATTAEGPEPTMATQPTAVTLAEPPEPSAAEISARLIAGTSLPVVPAQNELAALAQMAVTLSAAAAVPKALQNKPNDVFLVLCTARDIGMGLTTAMRECHVIEGRVTISPKAKLALLHQKGIGRMWPDPSNDGESATWYAIRNDMPDVQHSSTFTKADAETAKLLGKDNWQKYRPRMLSWRAAGYLLDDVFPEVGTGLYSPDELGAITDDDGVAIIDVIGHASPLPGTSAPRGHNAPPPPPEPPASAEDLAGLRARIAALAVLPAARGALVELWTKPRGEEGSEPTLPPIDRLMAKQVKIADAMVSSIEARAKKGEWGAWEPAGEPETAADAPAAPETAQEPAGDATEPDQADEPPAPAGDEITMAVIAEVKAMEPSEVTARLESMDLATDGRLDSKRHRLASAMIAARRSAS